MGKLKNLYLGISMLYQLDSVLAVCEAPFLRKTVHHAIFTRFSRLYWDWVTLSSICKVILMIPVLDLVYTCVLKKKNRAVEISVLYDVG